MRKKRGHFLIVVTLVLVGVLLCWNQARAEDSDGLDMHGTRGCLSLDLSKTELVETTAWGKTDSKSGINEYGSGYKIWFKNTFTDRNNLGVTYRLSSPYEMTDVIGLECYAMDKVGSGKFLFYVNGDPNVYYHRKDYDDIKDSIVSGNGMVYDMNSGWCYSPKLSSYAKLSTGITQRYGQQYVFFGLSHSFAREEQSIYLDNEKINGDKNGCVNLKLKEHKISLLKPEEVTRVEVDEKTGKISVLGEDEGYYPFTNVKLYLEDGNEDGYGYGASASVYRDEKITLGYSLKDAGICKLESFRFYSDSEKKNLLYEMNVNGKENTCTFTLDAELIQTLEKKTGEYQLTDIYVEPHFAATPVTVDFKEDVVETKNVKVVPDGTGTDGSKKYILKDTNLGATIGTFVMSPAAGIGDRLSVDYTPNNSYTGPYKFRYYEIRICESEEQVDGTDWDIAEYAADKVDIWQALHNTYFWLRAHVSLEAQIKLDDKTVTFNNQQIKIGDATVTWPEGFQKPTGEILYHYYTDEACQNELDVEKDGYPVNAGTYYVTATLRGDDYYEITESNKATLTIEKATPTLKNVTGSDITYGDSLSESKINEKTSKAYGVVGEDIPGTFEWTEETKANHPKAGTAYGDVKFTPNSTYSSNYTEAYGTGRVTVKKATPNIALQGVTKTFDGEGVTSVPASVTGINGESTGQEIVYEFYRDEKCEHEIETPVHAGTYYAQAYVLSNDNYTYSDTDDKIPATVTIEKRKGNLVQVPMPNQKYRVYMTNTVDDYRPQGTVSLTILKDGDERGKKTDIEITGTNGKYYAECSYGDLSSELTDFYVRAAYTEASGLQKVEDYEFIGDEMAFSNTDPGGAAIHKAVELTYGQGGKTCDVEADLEIKEANVTEVNVAMLNGDGVNSRDVVKVEPDGNGYTFLPQNAGTDTLALHVSGKKKDGTTKNWYLFYDCTVSPAEVALNLEEKTEVYAGNPVAANQATASINNGTVSVTDQLDITYSYYSDSEMKNELAETDENGKKVTKFPVDAGTYYVKAESAAERNYQAGTTNSTVTITPAEPTITMIPKAVVYNGKPQEMDAPIVTGIDGSTDESIDASRKPSGKVTLLYDGENELPKNVGEYTVTAVYTPGENDNYAQNPDDRTEKKLWITPADCKILLEPVKMVYNGKEADRNPISFIGVNGETEDSSNTKGYKYLYKSVAGLRYEEEVPKTAGTYFVYAVRPEVGNYKKAISDQSTVTIQPIEAAIKLSDVTTIYNGDPVELKELDAVKVFDQEGQQLTNDFVHYRYFADADGMVKIDAPTNAGTYYIQAYINGDMNYRSTESTIQKLTIKKAVPEISASASDITYGQMVSESELTVQATGVKEELLKGRGIWKASCRSIQPAVGSEAREFTFIPTGDAWKNYEKVDGTTNVTTNPYTPNIRVEEQTVTYTGNSVASKEAQVEGAEGMEVPSGTVTYSYYADAACENPVDAQDVKDAGVYYCKASYTSESENYANAESNMYTITIQKADAVISLWIPALGKDLTHGEITITGTLIGVFDNPTGTVTLFAKKSEDPESPYTEVAKDVSIQKNTDGTYGFRAKVAVEKAILDFKAVYNEGTKKNYRVADGEETGVDMSKDPQHIYFEDRLIETVYGADDFAVQVLEEEGTGTGAVTYSVMEKIGESDAIDVEKDGTIHIKELGTAFVKAIKAGDAKHRAAAAIMAIRITQAPLEIQMSDKTVTYTGERVEENAVTFLSNGKPVAEEEELSATYAYTYKIDGAAVVMSGQPVNAGVYTVSTYSEGNDHYLATEKRATAKLTIEKAPASILMETGDIDAEKGKLTLNGTLDGVFDDPTGTVTIYRKLSEEEDSAYKEAAGKIEIEQVNVDTFGFESEVQIEKGNVYDFKAVYTEGSLKNYDIVDGKVEKVNIDKAIDEEDKNDTDDDGNDDSDDSNVIDDSDNSDIIDDSDNMDEIDAQDTDKDKSADKNPSDGSRQKKAARTGDQTPIMLYLTLLAGSIVAIFAAIRWRRR